MPSNPFSTYTGSGQPSIGQVSTYNPFSVSNPNTSYYNSIFNTPVWNPNASTNIPTATMTAGGVTTQATNLDKILQGILSGFALFQKAPYVPTTIQPRQEPQIIYQPTGNQYASGGNTGSQIQEFIQNNTGLLLVGGLVVVAFFMKPPRR
jgi:hypothetical protein